MTNYSILLSSNAKRRLLEIIDYQTSQGQKSYGKQLVKQLLKEVKRLQPNPHIGQIEQLLQDRNITYRYLVFKDYKIIYSVHIENYLIRIADVFDTRQNPDKMENVY